MSPHLHLRSAGTSLVLDVSGPALPRVLHWGSDLGELGETELATLVAASVPATTHSAFDVPPALPLLAGERDGWSGTPGVEGHRTGAHPFPDWELTGAGVVATEGGVTVEAHDATAELALRLRLTLDARGVVVVATELRNTGSSPYEVTAVVPTLPVPAAAEEILDLTGRWCRERSPQRSAFQHGTHLRTSRRGRSGPDMTLLLAAGTPGFGFRSGEVWATHVAWSGNSSTLAEKLPERAGAAAGILGGGEHLLPGELVLAPGETYTAPDVWFVHSEAGLDGITHRVHRTLRARPHHVAPARPLVLNTWEAVYFDHDLATLSRLADVAASIGVERFVLDDGWFGGRRDDTKGLGDWYVSDAVWPGGLRPLSDHVHAAGMQFGLWVEPEMVNPDSDLVRAHPDWVLTPGAPLWRHQQVINLANPDAFAHLLDRLDAIVKENAVDYLKWDHNRDLHVAENPRAGLPHAGVHAQTVGIYALLDALRERNPGLEIESCASGGSRVDLGILEHTDRVWASDCNDAHERQAIQRWTTALVPPELVGTHVGPPVAHTTHRTASLAFRCATALFGHAGIEWDITTCSPEELAVLTRWTALYREQRDLLHSGDVVRADLPDAGALLHGVVSAEQDKGFFAFVRLLTAPETHPGRVRLPGLDPARRYRVRVRADLGAAQALQIAPPPWIADGDEGVVLPGSVLSGVGLPMPNLAPDSALLLEVSSA
ncbi:alpha-galactosidase [Kineococcus gynurae]|uniref:alpha-galactosidase n=1 Tax=Kineococcus gynurae TaxID=452979 RepID=A0ABV5LT49_9ACTN